jgi:hypothetical protein
MHEKHKLLVKLQHQSAFKGLICLLTLTVINYTCQKNALEESYILTKKNFCHRYMYQLKEFFMLKIFWLLL